MMGYQDSTALLSLRQRVQALITDSERVFLQFAKTFPAFVVEMKRSLELSSGAVLEMTDHSSMETALRQLFDSIGQTVSMASKHFKQLHERDDVLLDALNRGIETLSGLDAVIARIKEDSTEMELISLNAMTVALKAGASGKAFSVITDELKRLSTRTISLTDQLTGDGRHLLDLFEGYREELQRLEKLQSSLFEGLDERISSGFEELERLIHGIADSLKEMTERSRAIQGPVGLIMETVQVQDIVRQSLEHVLLALDEIEGDRVDSLNEDLEFRRRILELTEQILLDVHDRLNAALTTLETQSANLQAIVIDGEQRRKDLIARSGESGGVGETFSSVTNTLAKLDGDVSEYLKTKGSIGNNGNRLCTTVESLEKRFMAFSKIVNRFRTIDIASRIEVSKTAILRTMDDTVVEMSNLTVRIGDDVNEALGSTKVFMDDTRKSVRNYMASSGEEVDIASAAEDSLRDAHGRLTSLKGSLGAGARNFSLFTAEFIALIKATSTDVQMLRALVEQARSGAQQLASLREDTEAQIRASGQELQEEQVVSDKLKEIIERFTIYAHKRTAGDLGGFVVEAEAQNGDVTFF